MGRGLRSGFGTKLWEPSFGGLGTGTMFGDKAGCGRVSEEVGTLNLMLGSSVHDPLD